MKQLKNLGILVVAASFFTLPAFGQELKSYTGKDLLDELRLREAGAIKGALGIKKPWAEALTDVNICKLNQFAAETSESILNKLKLSKLNKYSSTVLFKELERRSIDKGIHGLDDRKDLFVIENERAELAAIGPGSTAFHDGVLKNAQAICCLVKSSKLTETPTGGLRLSTIPFSDSQHDTLKLCPLERFSTQPCGSFCSGFLIASDVVVTAGHCVNEANADEIRFLFGYRMTNANQAVTTFPKNEIYKVKEIIGRKLDPATGEDWAIVRLDHAVAGIAPLKFRKDGKIADGQSLYVIGFPSGLPCKVASGAKVLKNSDKFVFAGNLDTYAGNSGSAVFNLDTHEVEGILVRGGNDFQFVTDTLGGCIKSVVLTDGQGNEQCTRCSIFANVIP